MLLKLFLVLLISSARCSQILNKALDIKDNIFSEENVQDTIEAVGKEIDNLDMDKDSKIAQEFLNEVKSNQDLFGMDNPDMRDFFLKPECGIEWETCSETSPCCDSLYCSYLPALPPIESLQHNTSTISIKQMCSTIKTSNLADLQNNKTGEYGDLLDTYRNKMMAVLNS